MTTSTPIGEGKGGGEAATWPNAVTCGRILLVPVLVGSFYLPGPGGHVLGLAAFTVAALGDFLDGWLARRLDQRSALGSVLDPVADKLLVGAALVMLVAFEQAPAVAAAAIVAREFLVSGLREALPGAAALAVSRLANWKTFAQMGAVAVLLSGPLIPDSAGGFRAGFADAGEALLWLAVALTWITAFGYLRGALRRLLG